MLKPILSGIDTMLLCGHFQRAGGHMKAIERQMHVVHRDRGKIVPWVEFRNLAMGGSGPLTPFHKLLMRATYMAEKRMGDVKEVRRHEVPLSNISDAYLAHIPRFWENYAARSQTMTPKYLQDKMRFEMGAAQERLAQRDGVLHCARLADMLESYEIALSDPGFLATTIRETYLGRGDGVLQFWQAVGAMHSWNGIVDEVRDLKKAQASWPQPTETVSPVI